MARSRGARGEDDLHGPGHGHVQTEHTLEDREIELGFRIVCHLVDCSIRSGLRAVVPAEFLNSGFIVAVERLPQRGHRRTNTGVSHNTNNGSWPFHVQGYYRVGSATFTLVRLADAFTHSHLP